MGTAYPSFWLSHIGLVCVALATALQLLPTTGRLTSATSPTDVSHHHFLQAARSLLQNSTGEESPIENDDATPQKILLTPLKCETPACDDLPKVALVIYPGVFLLPEEYLDLANTLQIEAFSVMQMWIYIVPVDWDRSLEMFSTFGTPSLDEIVREMQATGFPPISVDTGNGTRYDNVFLGAHSIGGVPTLDRFPGARGIILMGAWIFPIQGRVSSLAQFPIPVLMAMGDLDGTVRLTQIAFNAVEMMQVALRKGIRYALKWKTVAVVKGMNHIQPSNSTTRLTSGDIEADIPLHVAIDKLANLMVAFMAINIGDNSSPEAGEHFNSLEVGMLNTVTVLGPYLSAMGYGNLMEAYEASKQGERHQGPILPGGLLDFGVWGEMIGESFFPNASAPFARTQIAHPGEAAATEALCVQAQQDFLPIMDDPRIDISGVVHTTLQYFQYSSPSIEGPNTDDLVEQNVDIGGLIVPSCFSYRQQLFEPVGPPVSIPQVWMKLASCDAAISAVSGPAACPAANFSAADFNRAVFEIALNLSTAEARERFEQRGRPIEFVDKTICDGKPCNDLDPMEWASPKHAINFDVYRNNGSTLLVELVTLVTGQPATVYLKSLTIARAIEYIMIDSLQIPLS